MAVENTSKTQKESWVLGINPGSIEAQEAEGQRQLAESSQLPTDGLTEEFATLHGITIHGKTDGDPIFTNVTLPAGWKIQPASHSMWSDLLDANGNKAARIFYKAAYYDRSAFMRPEQTNAPAE